MRWYFTFGVGTSLAGCHIVIEADDEHAARVAFIEQRTAAGLHARLGWSSVYGEAEWPEYVARYGPSVEVPVTTPCQGAMQW